MAYYRWCITRHSRAQYVEATLDMADMTSSETSAHEELRVSQMKSSKANVKKITEAVLSFTNPFALQNKQELYCLSSCVPATREVSRSLLQAIPDTLEEVAERVFTLLPKTQRVDFVTDSYYEHSNRAFERCRCGVWVIRKR